MTIFQISKLSQSAEKNGSRHKALDERPENYLTHPTLGLLYSVCPASDNVELFTTLYAKRIFFLVTSDAEHLNLESIGRQEARLFVERRLYDLRRLGQSQEYDKLMVMYQQTFG